MMKIRLERSGKFLKVLFSHAELAQNDLESSLSRCRYGSSRGVTFTFETWEQGFSLYVSFDRYKDAGVLRRISRGRRVAELQMLSELAHLPGAKIYVSEVPLPDGRYVEIIDTVRLELGKIADGVWEAGGIESEIDGLRRQMTLNGLKDRLPGFYLECGKDTIVASQTGSARRETIFAHRVKELKPEPGFHENRRKDEDSTSELKSDPRWQKEATLGHVLAPKEKRADLPQAGESKVAPLIVPEKRGSDELDECDECHEMFDKGSLFEIGPEFYVCWDCWDVCGNDAYEGLAADETIGSEDMTCQPDPKGGEPQADTYCTPEKRNPNENAECDGCNELFYERELIEIKPGLYVCKSCGDNDDTLRSLGLTPDEIESFERLIKCDRCGQLLTEVEPSCWLCPGCFRIEVRPPLLTKPGHALEKRPGSIESELKDGDVRWLKFKDDVTVDSRRMISVGTTVLGCLVSKPPLLPLFGGDAAVSWRVEFINGYSSLVDRESVEEIEPRGLPVKRIARWEETSERYSAASWITLKTDIEFAPGFGFEAGTRVLGYRVSEGWAIDFEYRTSLVVPASAVEVGGRIAALKFLELPLLETRVDIPIGPGKIISAGKWIMGTRVADGWKIGAEYSNAVEFIWRIREKGGFDMSDIVKADVTPSIIVPNSAVKLVGCVSW